jgi:GT2 family glycosyltransferase
VTTPATSAATRAHSSPRVRAILVLRNGARWLGETLDALAAQSQPPDRLVVLDLDPTDESREIVQDHDELRRSVKDLTILRATAGLSFGQAVSKALAESEPTADAEEEWLWLLRDDSAPDPRTLSRLLEAVRRSPSVGVAGPKVVQWDDPRRLVELGHQLTRSGRRIDAPAFGEPDQGQYDTRTDVLAVGTTGMLVRRDVVEDVHGFDDSLEQFGSDLDFGWRAQLAGHRVIVVPAARVRAVPSGRGDQPQGRTELRARRAERRAARRVALTRCAPWQAPFLALWIALTSIVGAALLLLLKRPRHAWSELADLGALGHPFSSLRSRWRYRAAKRLRRSHLSSLFVSPGASFRYTVDSIHDALTPERSARPAPAGITSASTEPGPVAQEAEDLTILPTSLPQRIATHPGMLAALACAMLAGLTFRGPVRGGLLDAQSAGLAGGELQAVATDSSGLWHLFRDAWHGSGFGTSLEVGPGVGVLAGLTWLVERLPYVSDGRSPASVTMAWLMLAAMPLSAATAYVGGRVATGSRWARGLAALAWGSSGVLFAALGEGRLPVAVAHILVPIAIAGFAMTAGRGGTFTAAFATALASAVIGAFVPAFLVIWAAAALVLLLLGPGLAGRARALVLLIVPVALLGPWVVRFADDPRLLLSGGGLLHLGGGSTPAWQIALGQPDGGRTLLLVLFAPVILAAVLALTRHGGVRGRSGALTSLGVLVLVGLVMSLGAGRVVVGQSLSDDGQPTMATLWSGVGLELYVAALLAVVLTGWHGLRDLRGRQWNPRRVVALVGTTLLVLSVGAAAGVSAWASLGDRVTVGQDALPAVAVDQATGPQANRLLVLSPSASRVDYRLVGSEPGELFRDIQRPQKVTDPGLGALVGSLASGVGDLPGGAGAQLANQGIGFVSLQAPADSALARSLDAAAGLTRLGSTKDQTLWRVLARTSTAAGAAGEPVPPSRVRVVDAQGGPLQAVDVVGPHGAVDTTLPAGPEGRRVVFAEAPEWASYARVTFNGTRLRVDSPELTPTYPLPTAAGRLVVDLPPAQRTWFLTQLGLLALVIFLAVPLGNRRSKRLA